MQEQETAQLLSMIQAYYPNSLKERDENLNMLTLEIWNELLKDASFYEMKQALLYWMQNENYAPKANQLLDLVIKMKNPQLLKTAELAWEEVCYAAGKFGYEGYEQAKEKFCDKTKRVLKAVKWWDICRSEYQEPIKKKFISLFNNITQTDKEKGKLPLHRALEILPEYAFTKDPEYQKQLAELLEIAEIRKMKNKAKGTPEE